MKAFILAGGFATRLWPLTEKRAKPLLPLASKPIITHLLDKVPEGMPVTVSTNAAFADGFKKWIDKMGRPEIELIVERTMRDDNKLGALGAIAQWVETEQIADDLLILTGDNYLGFSMHDFLSAYHDTPILAAHDIGNIQKAKSFGTIVPERTGECGARNEQYERRKRVLAFEEKPANPKSTLVSAGCVILPKSALQILMEYAKVKPDDLGGIFEELLRKDIPVECFTFTESWMDIGSFESYLSAHKELVGERALTEKSSQVERTELRGSVTIGKNCVIEDSELTDCMIFDNVEMQDCTLKNCIIDEDCVLKRIDMQKQMLRAGTHLIAE